MNKACWTVVWKGVGGGGRWGRGVGSALLSLQRNWDSLKISPRQLIRKRQAVAAKMFVVVRLFWL